MGVESDSMCEKNNKHDELIVKSFRLPFLDFLTENADERQLQYASLSTFD